MKHIVLLILLVTPSFFFGQNGYYGSFNSLELRYSVTPILGKVSTVNEGKTETTTKRVLPNTSFNLSYARILSKRLELAVGYTYKKGHLSTSKSTYFGVEKVFVNSSSGYSGNGSGYQEIEKIYSFLSSPDLIIHRINADLRFYRLGSLAPGGKYIGFGINLGFSSLKENTPFEVGIRNQIKSKGTFQSSYDIIHSETLYAKAEKYTFLQFNFKMGRNYMLTDRLLIAVNLSVPLFSPYYSGFEWHTYYRGIEDIAFLKFREPTVHKSNDLDKILINSMNKFTRTSLEVGLKFHL